MTNEKTNLRIAILIPTITAAVTVLVYAQKFATNGMGGPERWAQFGDYFGGILNPVVALAALFLLLENLRISRDELGKSSDELATSARALEEQSKEMRDRVKREDLYRAIEMLFEEVRSQFSLRLSSGPVIERSYDEVSTDLAEIFIQTHKLTPTKHFSRLQRNVAELADSLSKYESLVGVRFFSDYVRRSLFDDIETAYENDWLPEQDILVEYGKGWGEYQFVHEADQEVES